MSNQGDKHGSRYPSQSQPCFFVYLARRSPKRLCAQKYFDELLLFFLNDNFAINWCFSFITNYREVIMFIGAHFIDTQWCTIGRFCCLSWTCPAPQILGLSSGEGHCSEVLAWVCSRVSLCAWVKNCMSSDDIVWWVFSFYVMAGNVGRMMLFVCQRIAVRIGKLRRDAWHLANVPCY